MGGRTNTAAALKMSHEAIFQNSRGKRNDAPAYAIVITDGNSNIRSDDTIPQAIQVNT